MPSLAQRALHRFYKLKGRNWPQDDRDSPWFDQPDAMDVLERRFAEGRYSETEREQLAHWIEHGYVVVRGLAAEETIDGMLADLDALWEDGSAVFDMRFEQLRTSPDSAPGIIHSALLRLPAERRAELKTSQPWRLHGFHMHNRHAAALFHNAELQRICSLIFDRPAVPRYTINFTYGSEQELHQDSAVFHLYPRNYLIGAWLACEDISPDCGPLVYYPGSQRCPMFPGFPNYPQTNLRTADKETSAAYHAWLDEQALNYERKLFIAQKGDILLWNGMLFHGGSPIAQPGLTRKSYVCHYMVDGVDRADQVRGPFNW